MDKFLDLKVRFLSSVGLLIFAYIFAISSFLVASIFLAFIYAILIYEWHIASLKNKKLIDVMVFVFITCGIVAFSFVNMLRFQSVNPMIIPMIWVVFTAILTDTGAYFTGRIIGGYRPFITISPGKTLSGYIGGLIIGGCLPLLTAIFLQNSFLDMMQIIYLLFLGICLSIASMAGDLLQSYFKRCHNIKDTGKCLPGHGGLFDRFDGILGTSFMLLIIWLCQIITGVIS